VPPLLVSSTARIPCLVAFLASCSTRVAFFFLFPQGLIHFEFNPSHDKPAVAITTLSIQNPGAITISIAVFRSKRPIVDDILAKAF